MWMGFGCPCPPVRNDIVTRVTCFFFFVQDKYLGNSKNRFVYHNEGLQTLQVFKNGQLIPQSPQLCDMNLDDENSLANDFWYKELLRQFPKAVDSISRTSFYKEFYLFCISFESTPKYLMNQADGLNLNSTAAIDLRLKFKSSLTSNKIIQIASFEKSLVQCDASGNIEVS